MSEDVPTDESGRRAVLSAPVRVNRVRGTSRWGLGTRDAEFHDGSAASGVRAAAMMGRFSGPIFEALEASGRSPDDPLFRGVQGPVAWVHVFADPATADPTEDVQVVWAVEREVDT